MTIPVTFLQIVQKTHELSGLAGPGPAAVTGNTGVYAKLVNWVAEAWTTIQNLTTDWRFLRVPFNVTLTAGQSDFDLTAAPFSWTTFSAFYANGLTTNTPGMTDLGDLTLRPYPDFRLRYNPVTMIAGRPSVLTQPAATTIRFNTVLDASYEFRGDYRRKPQELSAGTDEPLLPREWRMLIVYEALKTVAYDRGTADLEKSATREWNKLYPNVLIAECEMPIVVGPVSLLGPDRD